MPSPENNEHLRKHPESRLADVAVGRVSRQARAAFNHHDGGILWMTGLSGSGKTTLATALEHALFERGYQVFMIDGDEIRKTLSADLGYSAADRSENIRRAGGVAGLFAQAGVIVIAAFISPYCADRNRLRSLYGRDFHEIWLSASLGVCEQRDVKGLYGRARRGELRDFTGISAPYEAPPTPDLTLDTSALTVDQSIAELLHYVNRRFGAMRAP